MDHHRLQADALQQRDVLGEGLLEALLHHGSAAVLDDRNLPGELGDVLEGLDQQRPLEGRAVVGDLLVLGHHPVRLLDDHGGVVGVDLSRSRRRGRTPTRWRGPRRR